MPKEWEIDTLAVHADGSKPYLGAVNEPIVLATTFAQPAPGRPLEYEYSRSGNPTRAALESALARLEGGRHGLAYASGTAAAMNVLALLDPGDQVVCSDDVYGGTFRLLRHAARTQQLEVKRVDLTRPGAVDVALTERTRLIWVETPSNPLLKVVDLTGLCDRARKAGVLVVVDNTFATPVLQRPLEFGAALVMHSTTKYINGHSDVVGGAIVTNDDELFESLRWAQNALGAVPSPFDCYLTLRGIKTLPLRVHRASDNAMALASRLLSHPAVQRVHYPGLQEHPGFALAQRQMLKPGAMISLELRGGTKPAESFLTKLRLFTLAESLGAVESLAEHPALMTHASIPEPERAVLGITGGLVRLSVGIEAADDLWEDLEQALAQVSGPIRS